MREAARQEGYRQGYEDGMKKAQVEGAAAMERQRSEQAQEVKRFLGAGHPGHGRTCWKKARMSCAT